jgi:hypothetical protein
MQNHCIWVVIMQAVLQMAGQSQGEDWIGEGVNRAS